MVLWEIALGTAYFLGLKRTYRLSLKLQRRLIADHRPQLRLFVRRQVRTVFDVALTVHKNVQQRDLEVGRNMGNWILRWLDRMKPSAQIRVDDPRKITSGSNYLRKFVTYERPTYNMLMQNVPRSQSLFSRLSVRARTFPTLSTMLRPMNPAGVNSQYRQMLYAPSLSYVTFNNGS